ncbi:MAG: EAL domain-containing protein, partial [Pseudomonadota bacterium]
DNLHAIQTFTQAFDAFAVLLAVFAGLICWHRGLKIARFFMLAWLTLLLGVLISTLRAAGLCPTIFITQYAVQLGSLIEVALLSFALADRINVLREKATSQDHQRQQLQEQYNQKLYKANARLQKLSEQLHQRSNYDELTLLPNRHLIMDLLKHEIRHANRNKTIVALMAIDLDRFKLINDNLGHQVGDQVLMEAAKRLQDSLREGDIVGRLGGDEFIVVLRNIKESKDILAFAEKVINVLQKPLQIQGHTLHLSASTGITAYPRNGRDAETLMKRADASMSHAKQQGLGISLYSKTLEQESQRRLSLETQLRQALEKGSEELELVFQPQHKTQTHEMTGVEALLRWQNKELGHVSPGYFIPIAEETGLINRVGEWVMESACQHIQVFHSSQWEHSSQWKDLKVSINLSAQHLLQPNFTKKVTDTIEAHQISPHSLEIEITEETFLSGVDIIKRNLSVLRELGITVAVDDFGTGYSSLSYLRNFPVDVLKLDGCFIEDLENNESDQGIVAASILLGHSLNLKVVAECVETREQLDFLAKHDCDIIQGYYFSKPLNLADLLNYQYKQLLTAES